MNLEIFETARLVLRKITPNDLIYMFENLDKNEIKHLLGYETEEDYIKEWNKYRHGYTSYNRSQLQFQLVHKDSNVIIGSCGFHNWFSDHRRAEVGYIMKREEYRGHGLMTEALGFVIRYGFSSMQLHRIEAYVGSDNIPSLRLMNKFDFTEEGVLREHYFTNDKFEDSIVFALLTPF